MNRETLEKDGYVIVKSFLSLEEVERLRVLCLSDNFKRKDSVILGDIIGHDVFREIIFSDKLTILLREILGEESVYICDGTARGDDKPLVKEARKFHTDSRADDFYFKKEYPIYRFGIYLQDTDDYSGGLKIRPESHKKLCVDHGTVLNGLYRFLKYLQTYKSFPPVSISSGKNIDAKAGDLVIWNMRLHHSGHAIRLKVCPKVSLYPWIENWVPDSWKIPEQFKRCVAFFAFGKKSDYLENYYHYINKHPDNISHWENSNFSSISLKEYLTQQQINILCDVAEYNNKESLDSYKETTFF